MTGPPNSDAPSSPDGWIEICRRELNNIRGSYRGSVSNDAKIEHALRATEAVLKAIIWKKERWNEWPLRRSKSGKHLYSHNLGRFLEWCDLHERLMKIDELRVSWQTIDNASVRHFRYLPECPSDAEANAVARSARHPDYGVVPWLLKIYEEMI